MYTVKVLAVTLRSDSNAEILHITIAVVSSYSTQFPLLTTLLLHVMHVISQSFAETKEPKLNSRQG